MRGSAPFFNPATPPVKLHARTANSPQARDLHRTVPLAGFAAEVMVSVMFYLLALGICILLLWILLAHGPQAALAAGWGFAVVCPTWMDRALGPLGLNFRIVITLLVVGGYLLSPAARPTGGWLLLDSLVVISYLTQLISQSYGYKLGPGMIWSTTVSWIFPYLLGRLSFPSLAEFRRLLPVGVLVGFVLCGWAMCEAVTKVNPVAALAGHGFSFNDPEQYRWGFKRAAGPVTHPIYFGLLSLLLLPWAVEAWALARRGEAPRWWRLAPLAVAGAVFFSMSRGPQLGLLIACYLIAVLRTPRWRTELIAGGLASLLLLAGGRELLGDALHSWSQEGRGGEKLILEVNGQLIEYSGTRHRWIQFLVFQEAMAEAGFFGFGQVSVAFEQHVSGHLQLLFHSIDNQYIYSIVTTGYVGFALFVSLAVVALAYAGRLIRGLPAEDSLLASSIAAVLAASLVTMLSVWFASDFGYLWLCLIGLLASWYAQEKASGGLTRQFTRPAEHRTGLARHLVPGHVRSGMEIA